MHTAHASPCAPVRKRNGQRVPVNRRCALERQAVVKEWATDSIHLPDTLHILNTESSVTLLLRSKQSSLVNLKCIKGAWPSTIPWQQTTVCCNGTLETPVIGQNLWGLRTESDVSSTGAEYPGRVKHLRWGFRKPRMGRAQWECSMMRTNKIGCSTEF